MEPCTDETVRKFFNTEYQFLDSDIVYPSNQPVDSPSRALVGTSFGKDSLLTYAVADEIGLEPEMVYVVEQSMTYEQKHKTELAKRFKNEFGKELNILKHETGKFRDYPHLGVPFTEIGLGTANNRVCAGVDTIRICTQIKVSAIWQRANRCLKLHGL